MRVSGIPSAAEAAFSVARLDVGAEAPTYRSCRLQPMLLLDRLQPASSYCLLRCCLLLDDERGGLGDLLLGDPVVDLDDDLIAARREAGERHGLFERQLIGVRVQLGCGFL